jgi:type III restriction enzyme
LLPKGKFKKPTADKVAEETIHYTGRDMLTKEVVEEQDLIIPVPDRPEGVISYFANMILRYAHMPGRFADLAPVAAEYLTKGLFDSPADLSNPHVIKRLSEPDARQFVISAFVDAINKLAIEPLPVRVSQPPRKVSATPAFPWSGETYAGEKTVFNLVACDSHYEALFASFLDRASDVAAYAKNAPQMHFYIEYIAAGGGIRYYYSDFVVRATNGDTFLIESKGWEDVEVPIKDDRARKWCHDVTDLTGQPWYYVKIPKTVFDGSTASTLDGLSRHALAAASQ